MHGAPAIINAHAGGGRAAQFEPILEVDGFTLHRARDAAHAEQLAADAAVACAPVVACAGGDGTIHHVVTAMRRAVDEGRCDRMPQLILLPAGTGNDTARALGLEPTPEGVRALLRSTATRPLDLVRVTSVGEPDRWVVNLANGGVAGKVAEAVQDADKSAPGPLAYLKALAAVATEFPQFDITLTIDGQTHRFPRAGAAMVANGPFAGGGWALVPDARPDDGLLNVLVVTDATQWDRVRAAARTLVSAHADDPIVRTWTGRSVRIDSAPPLPFSTDGEAVGQTPLTFTMEPAALRVRVLQ